MNTCIVMYRGLEMDCCGEPFKVGDIIEWPVRKWIPDWSKEALAVCKGDYAHDSHSSGEGIYILEAKIIEIQAIYCKYEKNKYVFIPVSARAVPITTTEDCYKGQSPDYRVMVEIISINPE